MRIDPLRSESFESYRALGTLVARQAAITPRHVAFLARRFGAATQDELRLCDELAAQIMLRAADDMDSFVAGYDFFCDIQMREELYFRRHGAYRLRTSREATEEVYANSSYMRSYMRGVLMTQVFWSNHTAAMRFYLEQFLRHNRDNYDLLEIGPGHGLLFSRAASDARARSLTGWDVSPASVQETRETLHKLGVVRPLALEVRNLLDSAGCDAAFDAIVLSEVLEHFEQPERALRAIWGLMRPGARLYVNVPVNSPAPDHLFLVRSPEDAVALVRSQGFEVERTGFFPATNYTLEAARKHALTISACIVATKQAS